MSAITEIHGWITLRYSPEWVDDKTDELHERLMPGVIADIRRIIAELPFHSADVRMVESYGEHFVVICGFRWNAGDAVLAEQLFARVAEQAKGSYGCLNCFDHDRDIVEILALRKGGLTRCRDPLFNPITAQIDEPYTG